MHTNECKQNKFLRNTSDRCDRLPSAMYYYALYVSHSHGWCKPFIPNHNIYGQASNHRRYPPPHPHYKSYMDKLSPHQYFVLLMLLCCTLLRTTLFVVKITKMLKRYIFRQVCLSSLTALVNVKVTEMANQIKERGLHCSHNPNMMLEF